ncbi:N-acyl-D-amino-acid deacylase family protein [Flavisphingomonas formosensis]|uniref:N-acyl-D-amino-acid deacylase family protein n=1 Tax=Flavisphingomonas formosensis TaxID=861534 RepID=UPI0012F79572|nr:amidohydrolase family protein [Sphingomonas formosensis]
MQRSYLIKGGTVVDGTGAAPFQADVRVANGVIAQIGADLEAGRRERVIDASGCYVTPGFIETHNHFDGPMWWMPTMEPMPGYGVTTSINGNCGFAAAPVHDDPVVRKEMVDIFSFFEDIPQKPFLDLLPWDWRRWSEYKASLQRNVKLPVNYAAFVGHIAIRLAVMGMDAWDRAATPAEIEAMCAHLEDALAAGALGLSSNLLDHDKKDRPVPSMKADDAEWAALLAVVARHPGRTVQVIVDYFMRMTGAASIERIAALAKEAGVRVQVTGGVPTLQFQAPMIPGALAAHEKRKADNRDDMWVSFGVNSITTVISFVSSLTFAQSNNYVWNEIIEAKEEEAKFALLESPEWRARARESWGKTFSHSPLGNPETIELFESETGAGPKGVHLAAYMRERGIDHPSDALAEWLLDNGIHSTLRLSDWDRHEETMRTLLRDPRAIGVNTDSGAHGKMFCGIGDNVLLLTKYVRDLGELKIEEAIHILTGKNAEHFGLADRGEIRVGKQADIVVFDLAEIERRKDVKVYDVPDGEGGRTYRYSRAPAPMRLTMVNGVPTFDDGMFSGFFPGRYIGPADPVLAEAAE